MDAKLLSDEYVLEAQFADENEIHQRTSARYRQRRHALPRVSRQDLHPHTWRQESGSKGAFAGSTPRAAVHDPWQSPSWGPCRVSCRKVLEVMMEALDAFHLNFGDQ